MTITEKQSSYSARSLTDAIAALPIPFDPSNNILDITDILSQLRTVDTSKLERIHTYLLSEYKQRDKNIKFREHKYKFLEFAQHKLEVEKNTHKYIPSVFAETHAVKEDVRCFANPLFFCRKALTILSRFRYTNLNSLLKLAKEPELTVEFDIDALNTVPTTFDEFAGWTTLLETAIAKELQKVGPLSWRTRRIRE